MVFISLQIRWSHHDGGYKCMGASPMFNSKCCQKMGKWPFMTFRFSGQGRRINLICPLLAHKKLGSIGSSKTRQNPVRMTRFWQALTVTLTRRGSRFAGIGIENLDLLAMDLCPALPPVMSSDRPSLGSAWCERYIFAQTFPSFQ